MTGTTRDASRPRVVIPDDISDSFARSTETDRLRAVADLDIHSAVLADEVDLARRISDAEIVLSFRPAFTKFPARVIAACPRLRMICISGTGVEDVDVAAASSRAIAVTNVVGSGNQAVAELAMALMFDVARYVSAQDRAIRSGAWQSSEGIELVGKTLGIVGLSAIAQCLARLASGMGMRVLSWSRNNDPARAAAVGATAATFEDVLAAADFLSLHVRLFPELVGFIGEKELAFMKPGAILINTARGELIDENALVAALSSGRLRGAGLDVFAQQPLPPDHALRHLPNVVMTPATGWNTADASLRMIGQSIDNVVGFIAGKPINVVNAVQLRGSQRREQEP
jgi:phosphoglycerate dehydrogenase-like enzyme